MDDADRKVPPLRRFTFELTEDSGLLAVRGEVIARNDDKLKQPNDGSVIQCSSLAAYQMARKRMNRRGLVLSYLGHARS